ncbi:MAG: protein O-mannosyl-transferase family, partial [Anaerolineae bacterium]
LMVLLVYVMWPAPAFWWGASLLLGVALAMMMLKVARPANRWLSLTILAGALALYAATCSRAALAADAGELQIVTNVLGIAHPPGYALYTMLGRLAALVPLGSPAYRINLFSAMTSALALYVGAELVRRETGSMVTGLVFATALGLSATFWVQSTTASIRSLVVLLLVLCVDALFRWRRDPSTQRLAWIGLMFGLGAGHHSSLLLLAPAIVAFVLACEPGLLRSPRRWLGPLGAFAASLLVWLYLPIRSAMGSPFDPEPITSVGAFLEHVLALGFRGDMLHFRTLPELAGRLDVFGQILRLELGWALVLGCLLGGVLLGRRDWRALLLLGGIWLLNAASALTYRAPQTVEYLLPSYASMLLTLAMGLGGWQAIGWLRDVRAVVLSGLLVIALANGASNWASLRALAEDSTDQRYAESLLNAAPEDALVLSNWHHATTMWYLQTVEGLRPDVKVVYVYPEGSTPNQEVWLRRIDEGLATRPVVVTNWFYAYESTGYRFLPLADAWQVLD